MKQDELQELWMSQATTLNQTPNFALLEELAAPVDFPDSANAKVSRTALLSYPVLRAVDLLSRGGNSPQDALWWLAIAISAAGIALIWLKRKRPIPPGLDRSVEDFRADMATEYTRRSRSARWTYMVPFVLAWLTLFIGEVQREQSLTLGVLMTPIFMVCAVVFYLRFRRSADARAGRRIMRGY